MELTQEHFNQVLSGLATKQDLQRLATKDDLQTLTSKEDLKDSVAPLATKEEIRQVGGQVEDLARMTSHGFTDVLEQLNVRTRVTRVEASLKRIGEALHLEL